MGTKKKLEDLKRGVTTPVSARELWDGDVGQVPGPDVRCILKLARAMHYAESTDCSISWNVQERARNYFNEHGLENTLDEAFRLEALALTE